MKISKQKFYELSVLTTYRLGLGGPFVEKEIEKIREIPNTFQELVFVRALHGFEPKFPAKHPFSKENFEYLLQITGMALTCGDDEFQADFFDFLDQHGKDLVDFSSEAQLECFYDFFFESLCGEVRRDLTFAGKMAAFVLKNFDEKLRSFDRVLSLTKAFYLASCDVDVFRIETARRNSGKRNGIIQPKGKTK